jgi:hypothetical protein
MNLNDTSDNLFNWYEQKSMKEFIEPDDYDYSATGIKPNSRTLVCGATGTGKTMALLHYLRLSPNLFGKIMVFYKEEEPIYDLLKKGIKQTEFYTSLSKLPPLNELRKDLEKEERVLVVLDDYMMELSQPQKYPNIADYLIRARKLNVSLFMLTQDYHTIKKNLRNQMTYVILFKSTDEADINLILSKFVKKDKRKKLLKAYEIITNTPHQFLKIQTTSCPDDKKFSKNFTSYIDIDQLMD